MSERETLVSVDLDDVACYHAIHGLEPPSPETRGVILQRCLPRFLELFDDLGIEATFFVIGRDLAREMADHGDGVAHLQQAIAAGHELANHSHAHAYDLVTWPREKILADLRQADETLRTLGVTPRGFRAPGYTHDRTILECVAALGYAYDSSTLPSPPYYAAKVAVIAAMALRGRSSQSMVRGMRSFSGSSRPHRLADLDLWELPMSVSPRLRIPLIGTSLLASPEGISTRLIATAAGLDHFHLELHGIDLADPDTDGYAPRLLALQPELKVPLNVRLGRLRALLRERGASQTLGTTVARRSSAARA